MYIDKNTDELVFSSGRREYQNLGVIGISPEGRITYGYDGGFDDFKWTKLEKIELANHMIQQWALYLDKANATSE